MSEQQRPRCTCLPYRAGGSGPERDCPVHGEQGERRVVICVICPTRTPEPHQLGEFPMTCYRCHIEADS